MMTREVGRAVLCTPLGDAALGHAAGERDSTLFVDGRNFGATEAKPEGDTFTVGEEQSAGRAVEFDGLRNW